VEFSTSSENRGRNGVKLTWVLVGHPKVLR
jgi:hypothetical protein